MVVLGGSTFTAVLSAVCCGSEWFTISLGSLMTPVPTFKGLLSAVSAHGKSGSTLGSLWFFPVHNHY